MNRSSGDVHRAHVIDADVRTVRVCSGVIASLISGAGKHRCGCAKQWLREGDDGWLP